MVGEAIPYFYLESIEVWGEAITLTMLAVILARVFLRLFVSLYETKRLKLSYIVIIGMFILEFFLSPIISQGFYFISRIILHGEDPGYLIERLIDIGAFGGEIQFGGLLGNVASIFLGAYLFGAMKDVYKYLDIKMFAYVFSLIPVRIATGLKHFHLGTVTDVPWGIKFPDGTIRHEPSFYEALSLAIIFLIALLIRKKIKRPGLLSLIIFSWISLSRVITDNFRSTETGAIFRFDCGFTLNQIVYGAIFTLSAGTIYCLWKKHRNQVLENVNANKRKEGSCIS